MTTASFRMNIRFQVVSGTGGEFEEAWLALASAAQEHPANVDQWLARSAEDPDVYYLTTDWRDESGYQDFLKSPGFAQHIVLLRKYRASDTMSPSVLVHHLRGPGN